jgi:(S)-ureidoglycine aminohydrolase
MDELPDGFRSRGAYGSHYHLITPDNRAVSALPELAATTVVKFVTPRRIPAAFAQYLLELAPGGGSNGGAVAVDGRFEHAFYSLDGGAVVTVDGSAHPLTAGRFAYAPPGCQVAIDNREDSGARVLWFKRAQESISGLQPPPEPLFGDQAAIPEPEYQPGLYRTVLFGDRDPRHDFVLIRMRFEPGVDLLMTELHDEEHGLYMTAGRGLYLLGADLHEVREGDFIYMAPYCPQSFVADPVVGAEYLLYKDTYRDGFGVAA